MEHSQSYALACFSGSLSVRHISNIKYLKKYVHISLFADVYWYDAHLISLELYPTVLVRSMLDDYSLRQPIAPSV